MRPAPFFPVVNSEPFGAFVHPVSHAYEVQYEKGDPRAALSSIGL